MLAFKELSKQKILIPLIVILFFNLPQAVADPVVKRTQTIESMVELDFQTKTLREKIITTRALGLYLQNLLPSKGSPYAHGYEYLNDLMLDSFKEAQKNSSEYMSQVLWLPNDQNKEIVDYFVSWVVRLKALDFMNLYLKNSILVEPLEKTLAQEKMLLFDKAYKLQKNLSTKYESQLLLEPKLSDQIQGAKNKIYLQFSKRILEMMKPHLDFVKNKDNSKAIEHLAFEISKMQYTDSSSKIKLQDQILKLFDPKSLEFQKFDQALTSVELPSSSDIEGTEESFEVVMRLELGYGLLKNILLNTKSW